MQNVSTLLGAHSLQQVQPVVTPSTNGEHSPAETFDSVVNAQTPLISDSKDTQIENQQTQNPIPSDNQGM